MCNDQEGELEKRDVGENIIGEKRHKWKAWKKGENVKGEYLKAKKHAKRVVYNIK